MNPELWTSSTRTEIRMTTAALGGAIVSIAEHFTSHAWALRWVFLLEGLIHVVLWFFARPRLTTTAIENARAAAAAV